MAVACFRSITWGIFLLIYGMILVEVNCEPYNLVIMISPDFVVKNLIWGVFFGCLTQSNIHLAWQ
jgi:hypothetical protein